MSDPAQREWREKVLHVLSDEIITPATVLQAVAQTIAVRPDLSVAQGEELAHSAQRAARQLRRLVENISLAEELCARRIGIDPEPCVVRDLLTAVSRHLPDEPRLRMPSGPDVLEERLEIDLNLAAWAVVAVIENALEFSPQTAPVDVRVARIGHSIQLIVIDRGPGVPEELRSGVFDLFTRKEIGDKREHRGLGIGLFVADSIMRLHNGQIVIGPPSERGHAVALSFPQG